MKKNILIVHYNTPHLTECLVRSINLFVKNAIIYIFDNSDSKPFTAKFDNVTILDNTMGQIIDFDKWLDTIKTKAHSDNKWASARHCYTIQKFIELIKENFILLDSDVLLKKDISELYNDNYVYVGDIEKWKGKERVLPYCCFINVKMCEEKNIHYFNKTYMVGLSPNNKYDTGANFFIECGKLPSKKICHKDYIVHLDNGSLLPNSKREELFLAKNKNLYINVDEMSYKEKLSKYLKDRHLNIDINNPKTIQDKLNWLKVNDMTQLNTDCSDKIKVHDYCVEKIGKDLCVPIIRVYSGTSEINWNELPEKFVLKCNHGSGMNIIVDKNNCDKRKIVDKLNSWMNTDFAFRNGFEMQYHDIERRVFAEEFIYDSSQQESLYDYKFWCFNGKPHFFTINDGHGHGSWMNFYNMDGNLIPCKRTDFMGTPKEEVKLPSKLNEMIEYATKLSNPFKFVRVDFYEVNGKVYLGELTFTPGSGFFKYKDKSYDLKFGDLLNLNIPKNKNKKVVYTCIVGDYDTLKEPTYINNDFDYICFTDSTNLNSKTWKIRPLPKETENLSQLKKQRYVKINPHKTLKDYDISIYVDGNITIKGDLNKFINGVMKENCSIYVPKHPVRQCIYDEAEAVIRIRKDKSEIVNPQIEGYRKEGFPKNYGLSQNNILLRKHNEKDCIKLMEDWFAELKDKSHRDQLSFNYVCWKNKDINITYIDKLIDNSIYFHKTTHSRRINSTTSNNSIKPNVSNENTKTKSVETKPIRPKVIDKIRERRRNIVRDTLKMRLL